MAFVVEDAGREAAKRPLRAGSARLGSAPNEQFQARFNFAYASFFIVDKPTQIKPGLGLQEHGSSANPD
jgi:hypothetical protein